MAAYGSSKDIAVYNSIGLKTGQIYIVGKASKKQHANAQVKYLILIWNANYFTCEKKGKVIDLFTHEHIFWEK